MARPYGAWPNVMSDYVAYTTVNQIPATCFAIPLPFANVMSDDVALTTINQIPNILVGLSC